MFGKGPPTFSKGKGINKSEFPAFEGSFPALGSEKEKGGGSGQKAAETD